MLDTAAPLTMVLAETTGTDTITYLHGLGLVAQSDGVSTEYFVNDGLGSVRQLVDPVGEVLLAQTYDPYGNLYASAGVDVTAFGYAGEQEDANGLVFLRARYYSPSTGRFLNTDPSGQEANPYQYAASNPVMFTDPSGLIPPECIADPYGELCRQATNPSDYSIYFTNYAALLWDPNLLDKFSLDDKAKSERAFAHFILDPAHFFQLYAAARWCDEEWRALDRFAQYSVFHTYADNLVLSMAPSQEFAKDLHQASLASWLSQAPTLATIGWWWGGEFLDKIIGRSTPLNGPPLGATATFSHNGVLEQMALYDIEGRVIVHLDPPDNYTNYWHYHEFPPGHPESGHGSGYPHPPLGDGTKSGAMRWVEENLGIPRSFWELDEPPG